MNSEFGGANIQAYLADLKAIQQDVVDDIDTHKSTRHYINRLQLTIGTTAVYQNFDVALNVLGGRLLGLDGTGPANNLDEINGLYAGMPIRDGFLFGMAVNNKLLMGESNYGHTSPLNDLDPFVTKIMQKFSSVSIRPDVLTAHFEYDAENLYDNTLAHPDNPDAKYLDNEQDPLKQTLAELCDSLYENRISSLSTWQQYEHDTRRFQYGYAIARAGMNGYSYHLTNQLDQLFQDPATPIDS